MTKVLEKTPLDFAHFIAFSSVVQQSIYRADFDNKYKDIAFAVPLYYQIMYGRKTRIKSIFSAVAFKVAD